MRLPALLTRGGQGRARPGPGLLDGVATTDYYCLCYKSIAVAVAVAVAVAKYMDKFPKKIYGQIKLAPHWLAGWLAGSSLADV